MYIFIAYGYIYIYGYTFKYIVMFDADDLNIF